MSMAIIRCSIVGLDDIFCFICHGSHDIVWLLCPFPGIHPQFLLLSSDFFILVHLFDTTVRIL